VNILTGVIENGQNPISRSQYGSGTMRMLLSESGSAQISGKKYPETI
jgi:hypothetical protein